MLKSKLNISAPGRLCLLGEHQDYFGLSIIAAAIDLRIFIKGTRRRDQMFKLDLPDIKEKDEFSLDLELGYVNERDYLKSAVNILRREGLEFPSGWDCKINGTIPINSGTASSSALVVAWIKFLLETAGDKRASDPKAVAELAFQAEVAEFKEPGGKMDHYASSLGGIVSIHFGDDFRIKKLKNRLKEFVLADSLIRKDTTGTLGLIKSNVLQGLSRIQEKFPDFNLHSIPKAQEKEEIEKIPPVEKRLLKGTIKTRDLTSEGEKLFGKENFDHRYFGQLLNRQQEVVRDYLRISAPKIDRMIEASLENGALGAKINGSGEGGCILAYTPGCADEVAEALKKLDTRPHIVHVDDGARID
jgi:galactokinase